MACARVSDLGSGGTRRGSGPARWVRQRGHHLVAAREPRLTADLDRQHANPLPDLLVARQHGIRAPVAALDQRAGGAEQRVAGLVGLDRRRRAVGDLDVRAGVAHEPRGAEVEHGGEAPGAYDGQRLLGRLEQGDRVVPLGVEVGDAREVLQHRGRPAARRTRADAQAVVLADEQQRAVAVHVREVRRRVEGACRRRVVQRGVAEACDDQRVLRPRRLPAQHVRESEGEAEPDRPRQVRGDRRRLRDDVQLRVSEDLVPAAGHRVRGRAGEAPERLAHRLDAPVDVRAGGVERTRAVVQQRGIGGPRQQADGGVRLVPGRADRVEARPSLLEPPRREVEVPALDLGLEERLELADKSVSQGVRLVRRTEVFDGAEEVLVDGLHGH